MAFSGATKMPAAILLGLTTNCCDFYHAGRFSSYTVMITIVAQCCMPQSSAISRGCILYVYDSAHNHR